jgi:uncharacterized protein YsxB (DUF464 family)
MITYNIQRVDNKIRKVVGKGHALFCQYGQDIVCAAVSTAFIMTANAIEFLGFKKLIETTMEEGYFELNVLHTNETIEGLLKNLEYTLNELTTQYQSHIKNQKEG